MAIRENFNAVRALEVLRCLFLHSSNWSQYVVVDGYRSNVGVAESLNRDIIRVNKWCDLWGLRLNASKTKTMKVSRSPKMHHQSSTLTLGRNVLKRSADLDILGVTFDAAIIEVSLIEIIKSIIFICIREDIKICASTFADLYTLIFSYASSYADLWILASDTSLECGGGEGYWDGQDIDRVGHERGRIL